MRRVVIRPIRTGGVIMSAISDSLIDTDDTDDTDDTEGADDTARPKDTGVVAACGYC
jgi:hypothetical protein